jgi:hypothetical protein
MKRIKYILLFVIGITFSTGVFAQLAEPGGGDGSAPSDTGIAGGGAPIGSGMILLIGLGSLYGGKKVYHMRNKVSSENISL